MKTCVRNVLASAMAVALMAGQAMAQTNYTWTQTAGGAQSWLTGANWSGGVEPLPVSGDTVDFSTVNILANTTLTLGADRTAEIWKFGDVTTIGQDWIVASGNTIILAGTTPTINVVNRIATLNNVVDGTAGLTKAGAGTLTLANTGNSYSGGTFINAGTLTYTSNNNLGLAGTRNITFGGSATLTGFDGSSLGSIAVNSGTASITAANYTFTSASGAGEIHFSTAGGSKKLILGNADALDGNLRLIYNGNHNNGGNVLLQFSDLGDAVGSKLQIQSGQSDSNQGGAIALSGDVGPLVFHNRQIQILARTASNWILRDNIFANNNSVAANTWIINTDLSYLDNQSRNFILSGSNTGNNEFAGKITNGSGTVNLGKTGNGTWILSGANTYSGTTTISAGILKANAANSLGRGNMIVTAGTLVIGAVGAMSNAASLYLPSATGKNITMDADMTIARLFLGGVQQPNGTFTSSGAGSAWMNTGSGTLTVGPTEVQPLFWDINASTAGAGGTSPGGTWDAVNTFWNALYDGLGSVGTWTAGRTAAFAAGTDATGTYTVTVDGTQDIGGLTFEEGTVTLSGGTALRLVSDAVAFVAASRTATVVTAISQDAPSRALTKLGTGTLVLSGDNDYTGATTLGEGTLTLAQTNAIASSSALTLATATTLALRSDADATFNTPSIPLPSASGNSVTIDVNNNGSGSGNTLGLKNGLTLLNNVTGAAITLNTTGGNGYSLSIPSLSITTSGGNNGGTATTLNPSVNTTIGTLTSTATTTDLQLNLGGAAGTVNTINTLTTVKPAAFNPTGTKNTAATWIVNNWTQVGGAFTVSAGTLTITGTLNVSGMADNSSRFFNVTGGTLNLNSVTALTNINAGRFVMTGGTLDNTSGSAKILSSNPLTTWNGNFAFAGSLGAQSDLNLGTGGVTLGIAAGTTRTVTVTNANTTFTVGGIIANGTTANSLTKAGPGTLKLSGVNTYSGITTINAGILSGVVGGSCNVSSFTVTNTTGSTAALGISVTNSTLQWSCTNLTLNTTDGGAQITFVFGVTPSPSQAPLRILNALTFNGTPTVVVDPANISSGKTYPLLIADVSAPLSLPTLSGVKGTLSWGGTGDRTLYLNTPASGTLIQLQ